MSNYLLRKNNFFIGKKNVVETISITISDTSDVLCFDLYLLNVRHRRYVQADIVFICYC